VEYRELGRTGKKVSIIGLGCENIDRKPYEQVKETIDAALENGVNILDVFMPGKEIRENIARAIGNRRDQVMIQGHIGSTDIAQQYGISRDLPAVRKYFEEMLRVFGGYIDFGMMFFIDSEKDYHDVFDTGFAGYAEQLKKQGDIGHIGFSSHNPETAKKVINTGLPEMMMFSINPAFDMLPSDEYILSHFEKGVAPDPYSQHTAVRLNRTFVNLANGCHRGGTRSAKSGKIECAFKCFGGFLHDIRFQGVWIEYGGMPDQRVWVLVMPYIIVIYLFQRIKARTEKFACCLYGGNGDIFR